MVGGPLPRCFFCREEISRVRVLEFVYEREEAQAHAECWLEFTAVRPTPEPPYEPQSAC